MAFYKLSTYGFPIHASLTPELTRDQNFLQHCFKRQYISYQINIPVYDFLAEVDRALFKNMSSMPGHPLYSSLPNTVLCASEIQAAISVGLIPHAFKIVLSIQRSNLM